MKDKKNKSITSEEKTLKKFNLKFALLIVLFVVFSLIGVFFISTYIRWKAEISNKNEILYFNQKEIKITSLKDFYGVDLDFNIDEDHAILMYCESNYGGECVTGDFVNKFENILRSPLLVINIIIFVDLFLLYFILKDKEIKKIYKVIGGIVVILYGVFNFGLEIYNFFDYYHLVNNTEYVVEGEIIKGIYSENEKKFKPVVKYETEKNTYIKYIDYEMNGLLKDSLNKKITLYYNYKNNENVTPKRKLTNYILPTMINIMIVIEGYIYLKEKNKES